MDPSTKRALLLPFATAIFAKVNGLRVITEQSGRHADSHRARMLESISDDIKKASNFIPHRQSVAAHKKAEALGVDLSEKTWHDQHSFDKGRVTFLVEHRVPVSMLREDCLKAATVEAVLDVLTEKLSVVWVTREEDAQLTELKFRSRRPDPDAAYAKARIELWEP